MSDPVVCIECGKRESDEHIGHAYRPAIWPLSGGDVALENDSKEPCIQKPSPPTQLREEHKIRTERGRSESR
jgi:hypothetical protein